MRQFQPDDAGQQAQQQQDMHRADRLIPVTTPTITVPTAPIPTQTAKEVPYLGDRFGRPFEQAEAQKGADHKARIPGQIPETIGIAKAGGKANFEHPGQHQK